MFPILIELFGLWRLNFLITTLTLLPFGLVAVGSPSEFPGRNLSLSEFVTAFGVFGTGVSLIVSLVYYTYRYPCGIAVSSLLVTAAITLVGFSMPAHGAALEWSALHAVLVSCLLFLGLLYRPMRTAIFATARPGGVLRTWDAASRFVVLIPFLGSVIGIPVLIMHWAASKRIATQT